MGERIWDRFLTDQDRAVFASSGFGARGGFGARPALLVIDVCYAFCDDRPLPILDSMRRWHTSCGAVAWEAMPHIKSLIDACHQKGLPVIYTTGTSRDDMWDAGSWRWKDGRMTSDARGDRPGNEIVADISPLASDIVVLKRKPSAFFGTDLASFLNLLGCDTLIMAGTTTSGCVRATAVDAFSLNYRVAIAEEACFDRSQASHAVSLCDLHAKYADVLGTAEILDYLQSLQSGMFELPGGA